MTLNDKIDLYMKTNNIANLKQLAEKAEIPYTTLKDFYDKKNADNSKFSTLKKLSIAMNTTMDYLAFDDLIDTKQVRIDGIDLSDNENVDFDKIDEHNKNIDEFSILFKKNRDILSPSDETLIRTIIEQRIKEIDNNENNDI